VHRDERHRVLPCRGGGEHHLRRQQAHHEVVRGDHADRHGEGGRVLVQADQREHDEEVEVQVGEPAPAVHQRRGGEQQPDGDDHRAAAPRGHHACEQRAQQRAEDVQPHDDGVRGRHVRMPGLPEQVDAAVPGQHRDRDHERDVQPQHDAQRAVPGAERPVGQLDARYLPAEYAHVHHHSSTAPASSPAAARI
jgi:hypothetical protein